MQALLLFPSVALKPALNSTIPKPEVSFGRSSRTGVKPC